MKTRFCESHSKNREQNVGNIAISWGFIRIAFLFLTLAASYTVNVSGTQTLKFSRESEADNGG